jgi:homoserine O-acetyltransferase
MATSLRRTTALLIAIFVAASCALQAQSPPGEATQQFASLGDFKLRSGEIIRDFKIGYRTLGKLNAAKSNAVLWCTALGGRSDDLLQYVGSRNVVDTDRYFVVLVDAIGNGVSSSPSNSKVQPLLQFPQFTIRDMVDAEHRLAVEVLHLPRLRAVVGVSMGGMQTFEWAFAYPEYMDLAVALLGSPQSTSADKLLWTAEIDAIELDPAWHHGNATGILERGPQLAGEIHVMNLTSPAYRATHTDSASFQAFLADTRSAWKGDGGSASDQIRQRQAILALDIPGEYGVSLEQAARRVRARMLVVVSPQDQMVNPKPAIEFARFANVPTVLLDSACGHNSLSCISVGPVVAQFLSDPASVHSQTLHDSTGEY